MSKENINIINTRYLRLQFEGYFACRIATDPDPTNEERGTSGYTMALASEDKLDQIIRLNVDNDFIAKNLRPPGDLIGMDVNLKRGVVVNNVVYKGVSYPDAPLMEASLNLEGKNGIFKGPTFESRNNITGSDDEFSFVITPFELKIIGKDNDIIIEAQDILDPREDAESQEIWRITDPSIYGRRLPVEAILNSMETNKAINVFDYYGYFRDRRQFLEGEIERCQKLLDKKQLTEEESQKLAVEIEQFKSRIYKIEFWGDRFSTKLGTRVTWDFGINGKKSATIPALFGAGRGRRQANSLRLGDNLLRIKEDFDWPIRFWFGGWDGDLLTGYMRGELKIPVEEID